MKYLYKISERSVVTLLRGVDFDLDEKIIYLKKEKEYISTNYLKHILVSKKSELVSFTFDLNDVEKIQNNIKEAYS